MKKLLAAIFAGLLALSVAAPAVAQDKKGEPKKAMKKGEGKKAEPMKKKSEPMKKKGDAKKKDAKK